MRIIGVIDLLAGRAVHARAGIRERYAAVTIAAGQPIDGDALALARVYRDRLGVDELYVADLDAIRDGLPPHTVTRAIAALGVPLWLDAGVRSPAAARLAREVGATHVIVALETLPSFAALAAMAREMPVAFGLDLRDGAPVAVAAALQLDAPLALAARAQEAGAGALVVVDLARVGTGRGVDVGLITRLRAHLPGVTLVAGGGVRTADDLDALARAGCDAALVATALHDGRIDPAQLRSSTSPTRGSAE